MRSTAIVVAALGPLLLAACNVSSRPDNGSHVTTPGNPDLTMTSNMNCPNPGPDGCPVDNCSDAAKLVYVVDENNELSSFAPDKLAFTAIGTLRCPAMPGATPFSMAVDRNADAWVLYNSGEVFKVNTTTAGCASTTFVPSQKGFDVFGMGFSTNMAGGTDETLYIAGGALSNIGTTSTLGSISMPQLKVTSIAGISGSPELTGISDATLWGFFPDATRPRVAEIDKATGALSNTKPLTQLAGMPLAWAFAYWGGDFWIFLETANDTSTNVWQLKAAGGVVKAIPDTGRTIVGAGVSTCAPTTIGITPAPTPSAPPDPAQR